MKRYAVLSLVIVVIISGIVIYYNRLWNLNIFLKGTEEIVNCFEIPTEGVPRCYPVEMVDYREVSRNEGELMLFGRTVWSKKINNALKGKPAVVPVEIYRRDEKSGKTQLISRGISSSEDGHIIFMIKKPEEKYIIKIDFKNAENCPEEFKSSEGIDIIDANVF
ncbi:MAG: hypothetical protein HWN67_16370 [Candidatus Helarchaeota archaeon]|nr:hypothetical protein [Candidatus Helarchaeota archaeon]